MGRGRQKAKQQKIARKLKYLTTDTDYDELAKELGAQDPGSGSFDPFAQDDGGSDAHDGVSTDGYADGYADAYSARKSAEDDLDAYAAWAAQAAAKTTGEKSADDGEPLDKDSGGPVKRPHPIPMPVPAALRKPASRKTDPKKPGSRKPSAK